MRIETNAQPPLWEPSEFQDPLKGKEVPAPSFMSSLRAGIQQIDTAQQEAEKAMQAGAVEGPRNVHESMLKLEEADIGLKLLVKTRDKALEAYQEVMRMQF